MGRVSGLFNTRAEAENAVQQLRLAGVPVENVNFMMQNPQALEDTDVAASANPVAGGLTGNWGTAGMTENDATVYQTGYERGGVILTSEVPDGMEATARAVLERFGSMAPDNARDLFESDPNYRLGENKGIGAEPIGGAIGTVVGGIIGTIAGPLGTIAGAAIGGAAGAGAGHLAANDEGSNAGPMTGGASGAVVGGAIGSIGGPIGTAIGAVVGGAAGGAIGEKATEAGAEATGDTARDRDYNAPVDTTTAAYNTASNINTAGTDYTVPPTDMSMSNTDSAINNTGTTIDPATGYTTTGNRAAGNSKPPVNDNLGNRYSGNFTDSGDSGVITAGSLADNMGSNANRTANILADNNIETGSNRLAGDNVNTTDTMDYDNGNTLDDSLGPDTSGSNDSNQIYNRDNLQL